MKEHRGMTKLWWPIELVVPPHMLVDKPAVSRSADGSGGGVSHRPYGGLCSRRNVD